MRRGERVIYFLGVEAQALADHLAGLPTDIAAIETMADEAMRRAGKVAVKEACKQLQQLRWRLHRAIESIEGDFDPNERAVESMERPDNADQIVGQADEQKVEGPTPVAPAKSPEDSNLGTCRPSENSPRASWPTE
jgi:hypothetical protein